VAEVNWTEEAERWLEDIFKFIADENPDTAARVISELYERAQVLIQHPRIGYLYEPSQRNVRILLYGHYRIAYLVKTNNEVDILGVFHGALDIGRYLS